MIVSPTGARRCRPPLLLLLALGLDLAGPGQVAAQQDAAPAPAPATDGLEQLAARVDAAHRTDPQASPPTSFRADLVISQIATDAEQRVEVELAVRFLEWRDGERLRPLIRYRVIDSARTVEQGRDRDDYWSLMDGQVQDLRRKELENDLADCRRNLKLARQLLRFCEPGRVLRGLSAPGPVQQEPLVLGRQAAVACVTISGRMASFPLRQQAGDDAPVHAKVWIGDGGADDGRLLALEVTPFGADGKEVRGQGEFLYFADHRLSKGRLIPMRVEHFAVGPDGARKVQMRVLLTTLELDAPLQPEAFDRPRQ